MTTQEKLSSAIKELKQSEEYGFLIDAIKEARDSRLSFSLSFGACLPERNALDRLKRAMEIKHGLPSGAL
jgi:hypothetical protein